MRVPEGYEAAFNGWGPVAWVVCLPILAIIAGIAFALPTLALVGAVGFLAQALWMIVTDRGLPVRATVTSRQGGVGFAAIALAGIGYGMTYLAQDERWMWLVAGLVIPIVALLGLILRGETPGLLYRRRWLTVLGYGCLVVAVLYIAAGGAT